LTVIAALHDVPRDAGQVEAGKAYHGATMRSGRAASLLTGAKSSDACRDGT
jgi:hypothetical protein